MRRFLSQPCAPASEGPAGSRGVEAGEGLDWSGQERKAGAWAHGCIGSAALEHLESFIYKAPGDPTGERPRYGGPAGRGVNRKGDGVVVRNATSCKVRWLGFQVVLTTHQQFELGDLLPPLGVSRSRTRRGCHKVILFTYSKLRNRGFILNALFPGRETKPLLIDALSGQSHADSFPAVAYIIPLSSGQARLSIAQYGATSSHVARTAFSKNGPGLETLVLIDPHHLPKPSFSLL